MKAGRTYITNGPSLDLTVNGQPIGAAVPTGAGPLEVEARALSHFPFDSVEIVRDGRVVHRQAWEKGCREATVRCAVKADTDGWIAARLWGNARDSFGHAIYAHTSPVYLEGGPAPAGRAAAAAYYVASADESLKWVDEVGRYNSDAQREEVRDLFRRARDVFAAL